MNERDKLIAQLIKEKGGTKEQYLQLLNKIAHHESAGTMDSKLKQFGGGPGRGKYQFEEGKNEGGIIAARRLSQYLDSTGSTIPEWLKKSTKNDTLDVSNLTSEQQDMLFLGNMRKHPKADFSKIWKGEESEQDFWANYHWAGNKKDRVKRLKAFDESMKTFKTKPVNNIPEPTQLEQPINLNTNSNVPIELQDIFTSVNNNHSLGGKLGLTNDKNLNEFNGGGTHEQNSLGGIPQGIGSNGKQNTVEEDETSFKLKNGKFIFSNRIGLFDTLNINKKLKNG